MFAQILRISRQKATTLLVRSRTSWPITWLDLHHVTCKWYDRYDTENGVCILWLLYLHGEEQNTWKFDVFRNMTFRQWERKGKFPLALRETICFMWNMFTLILHGTKLVSALQTVPYRPGCTRCKIGVDNYGLLRFSSWVKDCVNKTGKIFVEGDDIKLLKFFLPGIQRLFTRFPSRERLQVSVTRVKFTTYYSDGCYKLKRVSQIFSHTTWRIMDLFWYFSCSVLLVSKN